MSLETTACPFCTNVLTSPSTWLLANEHAVAFEDRYPSAPGHTLIIPRRHTPYLNDLTESETIAFWQLATSARRMYPELDATIGINDGPNAGQTVPHLHLHIIPRRSGDHTDPRGGIRWVLPDTAAYFGH